PIGVRWSAGDVVIDADHQQGSQDLIALDGELWHLGNRHNGMEVVRSRDGGATWEPVHLVDPPSEGSVSVLDVVRGADGRLVAAGSRGSRCQVSQDAGDGYRITGLCKRFRPTF